MVRAYWGTLLSVDDSVGRLYAYLEKTGQLDNTLFIFTSDNGLLEGEHGMVDKRTGHEPSLRIPLVVRYPGLTTTAKTVEAQTLTLDFASSILEICGAPPLPKTQGRSWKNLVTNGDPKLAHQLVLRIQLREAISLHAQCSSSPHQRVEIHTLSSW
jgi:N-acetylglucosamine-6-sulfatase